MQRLVTIQLMASTITASTFPQFFNRRTGTPYRDTRANNVTTGLAPQSGAQFAVSAVLLDILQLGTLTLNTFLTIDTGAEITSFDLLSFYWGLELSGVGADPLAESGTIYVVGYDINGKQLVKNFSVVPTRIIAAPMVQAVLPDFKNLQNVTIAVLKSELPPARTNLVLDNVIHVNYS
ncbi:hypothetical protein K461DRAFT_315758 [Myriangium duriaei CBS 260.36]|uniref:Uncharacterized protein n=1 Tax=Myriangium duriaei CBS 260.36 TaxID=1168546 RepID=A0A9P4MGB1_9PEZI|nr:hypothetical protein K461DRAFT_315758 [Myriangium duriaei CBS 260.36]